MTDTSKRRYPLPPGTRWGDPTFAPAQAAILEFLRAPPGCHHGWPAATIAVRMNMSRQAAQQTLERMSKHGTVVRVRRPGATHWVVWFAKEFLP